MSEVFVCYAREDRKWKERLVTFLDVMSHAKRFKFGAWDDSKIGLGQDWQENIDAAIEKASVAVLIVSADFFRSEFIREHELPKFMKREKAEDMTIVPLLARPCPWQEVGWLGSIQGYLDSAKVLSGLKDHDLETVLTEFVVEVGRIVDNSRVAPDKGDDEEAPPVEQMAVTPDLAAPNSATFEPPDRTGRRSQNGFLTNAGLVDLIEASAGPNTVVGLLCIFRTHKQRTWLVATNAHLYCLLDDAKTAANRRRIQWRMPLGQAAAASVRARPRPNRAAGLLDIGPRVNWLYSQKRLRPDPDALENAVRALVQRGREG